MRKMKDIIASDLQHMNSNDAGLLKVAYHVSLTSSSNSLLGKISWVYSYYGAIARIAAFLLRRYFNNGSARGCPRKGIVL